jgi:RNA polymerase sigma factor (sigma-70 family)
MTPLYPNKRKGAPAAPIEGPIDRHAAADRYYPYVQKVARHLARRLPAPIPLEDVVSAGMVGLMESVDRYDPSRAPSFDRYAAFRIKGAILDELEAADRRARCPQQQAPPACPFATPTPEKLLLVKEAVAHLSPTQQRVVRLRYFQDLNIEEIGQQLGVSEARACQIHRDAMEQLRALIE